MYDGDGQRVSAAVNGVVTRMLDGRYEWDGTLTIYYIAGGQRIALRKAGALRYLFNDHLGSTAVTSDAAGNSVAELRYRAFGQTRFALGSTPTSLRFTGQMQAPELGLYDYGARFYDPALGRFIQPDSLIPQPGNPLAWDRYAYTVNNPTNYTDPTGHTYCYAGKCHKVEPNIPKPLEILEKYIQRSNEGTTTSWGGLSTFERAILTQADWNEGVWKDSISGSDVTPADAMHDPVVWMVGLFTMGRSINTINILFSYSSHPIFHYSTTKLYRAVDSKELNDIYSFGKFRSEPNGMSMSGKWFATSAENAARWGKQFYQWSNDSFSIVETQVDNQVLKQMLHATNLDGIGTAYYAENFNSFSTINILNYVPYIKP